MLLPGDGRLSLQQPVHRYSFFDPVAKQLPKLAEAARQDHTQTTVFSGGGSGTPIALWHDPRKSAVIKKALDTGNSSPGQGELNQRLSAGW